MSTLTCPATPSSTEGVLEAGTMPRSGRAMTRCECVGVSFAQIAEHVAKEELSLDEVSRRTGCGGTCTACIPDLREFLARR